MIQTEVERGHVLAVLADGAITWRGLRRRLAWRKLDPKVVRAALDSCVSRGQAQTFKVQRPRMSTWRGAKRPMKVYALTDEGRAFMQRAERLAEALSEL